MSGLLDAFARNVTDVHGEAGREWLLRLPNLLLESERRWSLSIQLPVTSLSYNYVAPATRVDGTSVILKAGVPHPEIRSEIESLRTFGGRGVVRLIDADPDRGILILEHAKPGTPVRQLTDDRQATSIAGSIMRQLWQPAPQDHTFRTVADRCVALDRHSGTLPHDLVEDARRLRAELARSPTSMLLHGDLHHDNIVSAERQEWLAIDPKGIVGDPAFDCGPWLSNIAPQFLEQASAEDIIGRRIRQLAEELDLEAERIRAWGFVHAMLSACWSFEDHGGGWEWAVFCARTLAHL